MISDHVYELCRGASSVSSELAKNPAESPGEAAKRLYSSGSNSHKPSTEAFARDGKKHDLDRAADCGNWGGVRPSDLFLKV